METDLSYIPDELDKALVPPSWLWTMISSIDGYIDDPHTGHSMHISSVKLDMPLEMDMYMDEDGKVSLGSAPPIFDIHSSFTQPLHRIRLILEPVNGETQ